MKKYFYKLLCVFFVLLLFLLLNGCKEANIKGTSSDTTASDYTVDSEYSETVSENDEDDSKPIFVIDNSETETPSSSNPKPKPNSTSTITLPSTPSNSNINSNQSENKTSYSDAEYEHELFNIESDYSLKSADIKRKCQDDQINALTTKKSLETEIRNLQSKCLSEQTQINNQISSLERQKQSALSQALASAGGQISSYYTTLEKQYNTQIENARSNLASVNNSYSAKISNIQSQIDSLPSAEDYEKIRDDALAELEKEKEKKIAELNKKYGK